MLSLCPGSCQVISLGWVPPTEHQLTLPPSNGSIRTRHSSKPPFFCLYQAASSLFKARNSSLTSKLKWCAQMTHLGLASGCSSSVPIVCCFLGPPLAQVPGIHHHIIQKHWAYLWLLYVITSPSNARREIKALPKIFLEKWKTQLFYLRKMDSIIKQPGVSFIGSTL